jgi:hypothetical protein
LTLSDLESALPSTKFALVGLFSPLLLQHTLGRAIVVEREVQIQVQVIPDRLPDPGPMHGIQLGPVLQLPALGPSPTTASFIRARGSGGDLGSWAECSLRLTHLAVPVPGWNLVKAQTVQMRRSIAAVTEQEYVFIIGLTADGARLEVGEVILDIFNHHRRIDVGHLDSVLNGI